MSAGYRTPSGWSPTDKTIHRTFKTGSFATGVKLINAVAELAEKANHHPDIILTYLAVIITLTTHDQGLVTAADIELAGQINDLWDREFAPVKKVAE